MSDPLLVKGLADVLRKLDGFSDRRMAAAMATAMSRTASGLRAQLKVELARHIDRPTPYTLNSLMLKTATAQRLEAGVFFKNDKSGNNTPSTHYMLPQVEGGGRRDKRFERALKALGALPDGWLVVPGDGARIDSYGNVDKGQVLQVLAQLRAGGVGVEKGAATKRTRAQEKAGGQFFVSPVGGRRQPGVYQREFFGRNITPVFIFVRSISYRRQFDFYGLGQQYVDKTLPQEIERSIGEHIKRLAAKAGA